VSPQAWWEAARVGGLSGDVRPHGWRRGRPQG
jgi:hypothetical protein